MNEKSISSTSNSTKSLEEKSTRLEARISEIDAAIEHIKNDTILGLNVLIEAIEEDILGLKHNDTQLQTKIYTLKDDFGALKYDFVSFNSTIQQFNYTALIDNLQDVITILNGDIDTLKGDIKALEDKVNDLDIHDSVLKTAIGNLQNDTEALENELKELLAKTTILELKSDNHEIRLNDLDDLVTDLKIDLNNLESDVDSIDNNLQAEIDRLQIKTDDLQKELNRVHENSDQGDTEFRSEIENVKNDLDKLSDDRYCIVLTPHLSPDSNPGDEISIWKNNQLFEKTPDGSNFNQPHRSCFYSFPSSDDIIELRNGGTDGVRISLGLIYGGISTQLFFGPNADLFSVVIDKNNNECSEKNEITSKIRIQDGKIIESECLGNFTLTHLIASFYRFLVSITRKPNPNMKI